MRTRVLAAMNAPNNQKPLMNFRTIVSVSMLTGLLTQTGFAEDAYYHLAIGSLTFTEGTLPARAEPPHVRRWQIIPAFQSYATLDSPGEVYIGGEGPQPWNLPNNFFE